MRNSCVKRVHDYWHEIRPEGGLPHRSDFSPADIKECLPFIFIIERKDRQDGAEPDYIFRLIGTQLVEFFGVDPTGRSVIEILAPEVVEFFKAFYEHLLDHPVGGLLYFEQSFGREKNSELEFLYLPMILDEDKGSAELILVTAVVLDDEVRLSDMGGRWDTPKLTAGGWLDIGSGKPETTLLQDACAAVGAEYMDY